MTTDDGDDDGVEDGDDFDDELLRLLAATPRIRRPRDRVGTVVGPFRIEALLGRGGMGEVWRATDQRLGRLVALKLIWRDGEGDGDRDDDAWLAEARAAVAVAHPRVATVFDVGVVSDDDEVGGDGRLAWIAMEVVGGETLRSRLASGPLGVDDAMAIAIDVADALAAIHARGLVHGDIKPDNLARRDDGRVCVLDFGVATSVGGAFAGGTRGYLPPELGAGGRSPADDVYAVGLTLIELMSAQPPSTTHISATGHLAGIVARCLAPAPALRFADGAALATALQGHLRRRRRRHRPLLLLAAAALVTATVALAVTSAMTPTLSPARASVPVVSSDLRLQARFVTAVDAIYAGDIAAAAGPLAEVVLAAPDEPDAAWAWTLLALVGESQRADVSTDDAIARARRLQPSPTPALAALQTLALHRAPQHPQGVVVDDATRQAALAAFDQTAPEAWFQRALLAWTIPWQDSVNEKLSRLDAVVAVDDSVVLPWFARVNALLRAGRDEDAVAVAETGLRRHPGSAALVAVVVRRLIADGDLEVAEQRLAAHLRHAPDDLEARFLAVDLALRKNDPAGARAVTERLLDGPFPPATTAKAAALVGLGLLGLGRVDDGVALLDRGVARLHDLGDDAQAAGFIVRAALPLADLGMAPRMLEATKQLSGPWHPAVEHVVLALTLAAVGDDKGTDMARSAMAADIVRPAGFSLDELLALVAWQRAAACGRQGACRQLPPPPRPNGADGDGLAARMRRTVLIAQQQQPATTALLRSAAADADACADTTLFFEMPCRIVAVEALVSLAEAPDTGDAERAALGTRGRALWPAPDTRLSLARRLAALP